MKYIAYILCSIILIVSLGATTHAANNDFNILDNTTENLNTGNADRGTKANNSKLDDFRKSDDNFFDVWDGGAREAQNVLLRIARDLKNLFFMVATVYLLSIIYRLVFAGKGNTEEETNKFKNGLVWTLVGIIFMQISYLFVITIYDKWVGWGLANEFIESILNPLIDFLQVAASFFFVGMAIYSFYQIVTAGWDEEKVKKWKISVLYGIIWYIIIRFSETLVNGIYGRIDCRGWDLLISNDCVRRNDIWEASGIVVTIIDWLNSFVWIAMVIYIIYAWAKIFFANGDEEKLKTAKTSIIYIAIGLGILITSYIILTFFIGPDRII